MAGIAGGVALTAAVAAVIVRGGSAGGDVVEGWPAIVEKAAAAGIHFADEPTPMPAVAATDLDGRPVQSGDWAGKVVVVNFWATWCLPCERELPDFVRLQEKYREHVQFVGFAVDAEATADVRAFVEKYGVNYPIAQVGPELEAQFGGILGLPTSFVVDRQGRVVQTHIGWVSPSIYEQEIRLLAGLEPLPANGSQGE
jgi:thiol-disulfide isomerase/thioredoxin